MFKFEYIYLIVYLIYTIKAEDNCCNYLEPRLGKYIFQGEGF